MAELLPRQRVGIRLLQRTDGSTVGCGGRGGAVWAWRCGVGVAELRMDLQFPATQPDQTLCFENKRRIINEKHSAWMEQRDRALAAEKGREDVPTLRSTIENLHRDALASVSRYDDEKSQLSKLPPRRRRAAMQQKRASWMEQRGQDVPSVLPHTQQTAADFGSSTVASSTVAGAAGNELLAQLHAERQARAATAVGRTTAPTGSLTQATHCHSMAMTQPEEATNAHCDIQASQDSTSLGWACSACTFAHAVPAQVCEMCGTPREPASSTLGSRRSTDADVLNDLDAELGLEEDSGQLEEIDNFLAAVELDLQRDD